jgi:hypothetical protein
MVQRDTPVGSLTSCAGRQSARTLEMFLMTHSMDSSRYQSLLILSSVRGTDATLVELPSTLVNVYGIFYGS